MPLWFDLLRTPMAAPETARLRRARIIWQLCCVLTALWVGFFTPLRHLLGEAAPIGAAALMLITIVQSVLYWAAKQRADNHVFDAEEPTE